jgi:hypothetical protein
LPATPARCSAMMLSAKVWGSPVPRRAPVSQDLYLPAAQEDRRESTPSPLHSEQLRNGLPAGTEASFRRPGTSPSCRGSTIPRPVRGRVGVVTPESVAYTKVYKYSPRCL